MLLMQGSQGEFIEALVSDQVGENRFLEFKRELPEKSEQGKVEFLKDVTAFANASGGQIIFGVSDSDGVATSVEPIQNESFDEAVRRLGQLLDAFVEPRISNIHFEKIEYGSGYICTLRIPDSFSSPHRINHSGKTRFVIREQAYTRDMEYNEIRDSFARLPNRQNGARVFRENRLHGMATDSLPLITRPGPKCAVHIVPIGSQFDDNRFDVEAIGENWAKFMGLRWGGASPLHNLDGLLVFPGGEPRELKAYTQVFRDGKIETVFGISQSFSDFQDTIPSVSLCDDFRRAISSACAEYRSQGLGGPAVLMVSLLSVKGMNLGVGDQYFASRTVPGDRDDMVLPDVLVGQVADEDEVNRALRKISDIVWQCFGRPKCTYFDEDGKYNPP